MTLLSVIAGVYRDVGSPWGPVTLLSTIFILLHYVVYVYFLFSGVIKMGDFRICPVFCCTQLFGGLRKM